MINNYNIIRPLLKFEENDGNFYFLQIIQRKKEHPELGRNNRLIKAYYIYSLEKFDKLENEIIDLCNLFNARAYINLNRRNNKAIALEMIVNLANRVKNEQYENLHNLFNTISGQTHIKEDKTWVVDIDSKLPAYVMQIESFINRLQPEGIKSIAVIPTKNGYHLITKPFNSMEFGKIHPEIEIHKNNPTILIAI